MAVQQRVIWEYEQVEPGQASNTQTNEVTPESIAKYAHSVRNTEPGYQTGSGPVGEMTALATQIFSLAPKNRGGIAEKNGFEVVTSRATPFSKVEGRWLLPVRAGDAIASVARVLEKYERRGSKFVTIRLEPENQRGEKVAEIDHTSIFEFGGGDRKKGDLPARSAEALEPSPLEETDTTLPIETASFDSISVGDVVPPLTIHAPTKPPKEEGDSEGRFPWGSEHGVGGITVTGYVEHALERWVPSATFYYGGRMLFKAIKNFRPGDTVTYRGLVVDKLQEGDKGLVDFEVQGVNQLGALTGFAEATMVVRRG